MNVTIWYTELERSRIVCNALVEGIVATDTSVKVSLRHYNGYRSPAGELALFYGLPGRLRDAIHEYRDHNKTAVLFDLGYWLRKPGVYSERYEGYHRIAVNQLHSTPKPGCPSDRLESFGVKVHKQRLQPSSGHILLCGQSEKAATVYSLRPQEWEEAMVKRLREQYPDKTIYYYPKLSWRGATEIDGTIFWRGADHDEIESAPIFLQADVIITHHSNMAVRACAHGIPFATYDGACRMVQRSTGVSMYAEPQERIDWSIAPYEVRYQFLNDLAYMQWKVAEMRSGAFWRHFKKEWL